MDISFSRESCLTDGANYWQDHGEQKEAIGHSKDDNSKPEAEEDHKDVALCSAQRDDSQESWEATMEYRGAHATDSFASLVYSFLCYGHLCRSFNDKEGVSYVSRVINGQAYCNNYVNHYNIVERQVPVVD